MTGAVASLPKTRVWGFDLPDPAAASGEPPLLAAFRIWPGAGVTTTTCRAVPDYLRARYYDPSTGQFISRDPAVAMTREPYAYVGDNPLNATDPTGLDAGVLGWIGQTFESNPVIFAPLVVAAPYAAALVVVGAMAYDQYQHGDSIIQTVTTYNDDPNAGIDFSKKGEHTKGARPSTKDKHEKGQGRTGNDRPGGEKGDKNRTYRQGGKNTRVSLFDDGSFNCDAVA